MPPLSIAPIILEDILIDFDRIFCKFPKTNKPKILEEKENKQFKLRATDEFIELNNLLKIMDIAQSGGHAKMMIEEGFVFVK